MSKGSAGAGRQPGSGNKGWYVIRNSATGPAEITIYDEIGAFGITAQDFKNDLQSLDGPVSIRLNSEGGEVFAGLAIYNALKERSERHPVAITIDGLAASISSVISQAASPGLLSIAESGTMMIHDAHSATAGNAEELRRLSELLDQQSDNIAGIYAKRTGRPASYWREQMKKETWLVGQEAVDAGLADHVTGGPGVRANCNPAKYKNIPEKVLVALSSGRPRPTAVAWQFDLADVVKVKPGCEHEPGHAGTAATVAEVNGNALGLVFPGASGIYRWYADNELLLVEEQNQSANGGPPPMAKTKLKLKNNDNGNGDNGDNGDESGWVCDPDGTCRFDPDGDGDDDSTPEGDTDHDYFAPDGTPVKPIPPMPPGMKKQSKQLKKAAKKAAAAAKANFKPMDEGVDNSPWDASKAWSAGAKSDDPAAFYKGICAGRRAGDPKLQSSWALPYKYTPSSPPNAAAVRNALARIGQAQGLTNREEAQSLLEGLMKKVNPDYEPSSDSIDPSMLQSLLTIALEGGR